MFNEDIVYKIWKDFSINVGEDWCEISMQSVLPVFGQIMKIVCEEGD